MIINIEKMQIKFYKGEWWIYFTYPQYAKKRIILSQSNIYIGNYGLLFSDNTQCLWFMVSPINKIILNTECTNLLFDWVFNNNLYIKSIGICN